MVPYLLKAAFLAALLFAAGCGGDAGDGPQRFHLAGTVTLDGAPVPYGDIYFEPDVSAGNDGPQASARIVAGRYETEPGKGTVGGPHLVRFVTYEEKPTTSSVTPQSFQITVDLPRQAATRDFALPPQK